MRKDPALLNEKSAAHKAAQFRSATTEDEWFNLLGSLADSLRQVYIVVDTGVLSGSVNAQ